MRNNAYSFKKNIQILKNDQILNVELPNTNSVSLKVAPRRSVLSRPSDTLDNT